MVEPPIIVFRDFVPGETRTASFVIRNDGGSYERIWFSNPDTWVKVTDYESVEAEDELPLKVDIAATGLGYGRHYDEKIVVRLDDVEAEVKFHLHTQPVPAPRSARPAAASTAAPGLLARVGLVGVAAAVAAVFILIITSLPEGGGTPTRNYSPVYANQYTPPTSGGVQRNFSGFPSGGLENMPGALSIYGSQFGTNGYQPNIPGMPNYPGSRPGISGFGNSVPSNGPSIPGFNRPNSGGFRPGNSGSRPGFSGSRPSSSGGLDRGV